MTTEPSAATARPIAAHGVSLKSTLALDIAAIVICALIWGTTFYAITLQLGVVDPVVSVAYRFALSAALLFAWCKLCGEKIALTRRQHLAAIGVGVFLFGFSYSLVYFAEQYVVSAVVAVVYASSAFVNLIAFRLAIGVKARLISWLGAGFGVAGVALISWSEIASGSASESAIIGVGCSVLAVLMASAGNVAAQRGEEAGAPVTSLTAWSMAYGAAALATFAQASGRAWAFEATPAYIGSLLYLSLAGSVIAFLLYFGLARRRGYATASYIGAMAPLVAMLVSSVMEGKTWGLIAVVAVALVLMGQVLLFRGKRA
ncbi:MAG: EamA family transporter [Parvularculaceae bacterium]